MACLHTGCFLLLGNHHGVTHCLRSHVTVMLLHAALNEHLSLDLTVLPQITTVGYGDLTAQTFDEIIVSIVVLIVGAVAFGKSSPILIRVMLSTLQLVE